MSRTGKAPVLIPQGVSVNAKEGEVEVAGPLGKLSMKVHPAIKVSSADSKILLTRIDDGKESKSLHGLMRSLVNNMVTGVTKGFEKKLTISGIGFRAEVNGSNLALSIGLSHPVEFPIPAGIKIMVEKQLITVSGIDKQLVGETAATIRKLKKTEPYKLKGIKYENEIVKKKAGKAAVSAGFGSGPAK